jgi:DNA-binding transcriptional MerR regulator
MRKDLVIIGETARRLACHPVTVKALEKRGFLTGYRDYRGWRFYDAEEVERVRIQRLSPPQPQNCSAQLDQDR